jgi:hypothetical protein
MINHRKILINYLALWHPPFGLLGFCLSPVGVLHFEWSPPLGQFGSAFLRRGIRQMCQWQMGQKWQNIGKLEVPKASTVRGHKGLWIK